MKSLKLAGDMPIMRKLSDLMSKFARLLVAL